MTAWPTAALEAIWHAYGLESVPGNQPDKVAGDGRFLMWRRDVPFQSCPPVPPTEHWYKAEEYKVCPDCGAEGDNLGSAPPCGCRVAPATRELWISIEVERSREIAPLPHEVGA